MENKIYPTKLYSFILRMGEGIINMSGSSLEDVNAGMNQYIIDKVYPLLTDPTKVKIEAKLISIQDLQSFGKALDMPPTSSINFIAPPEGKEAEKVESTPLTFEQFKQSAGSCPDIKVERGKPTENEVKWAKEILKLNRINKKK